MKKLKNMKGLIIFLVVIGAASYFGWSYYQSKKTPDIKFITAPAERGDMRSVILATGKVEAVSLINVGTQISGTLKELYVDYNSVVSKGQLIAVIDPSTQEADLAQASATLLANQADLAEARANLANARQNLNRSKQLAERDLIARADLDTDQTGVATAEARVAAAQARIAQQKATIEKARLQLGYTRIYSPVDGVVVTKNVDVGQTVAASFNTPTLVEIAEDLSRMQVEVNIDEADIGSVHDGQRVEFTVDAFPERKFTGTVTQIRLSPTTENNVISYTAIVSFENEQIHGQNLIPGMTANVTLIVQEKTGVVMVPNAALRFRPLTPGATAAAPTGGGGPGMGGGASQAGTASTGRRQSTVYRLENGQPAKMEVERGITDGTNTEITAGLDEGTDVIVGIDVPRDK